MGAVVGPDTPIVVGLALGVFAVFVIQEDDNFVHHWRGHGKSGTEDRPRKLQCEICADALVSDEIFKAHAGIRGWVVMKLDAVVDALFDRIMHSGVELGLRQTLTELQIALVKKLVPWSRHPVDVPEPPADAYASTMFRIIRLCCDVPAAPQLGIGRLLILASAFDVHDCVARDPPFALELGAELARRAKFYIVREKVVISRVGSPLDDNPIRLQHEALDHAVITASAEQEHDPGHSDHENTAACSHFDPRCHCNHCNHRLLRGSAAPRVSIITKVSWDNRRADSV